MKFVRGNAVRMESADVLLVKMKTSIKNIPNSYKYSEFLQVFANELSGWKKDSHEIVADWIFVKHDFVKDSKFNDEIEGIFGKVIKAIAPDIAKETIAYRLSTIEDDIERQKSIAFYAARFEKREEQSDIYLLIKNSTR